MKIKQIDNIEVSQQLGISQQELESFINGLNDLNAQHLEQINQKWPEMIAYIFDIDESLCEQIEWSL